MKVAIVGPIKSNAKQGKTNPKVFIYQEAFNRIGYETKLFSTSVPKYRPILLLKNISKSLKYGDSVVLMLGGSASRRLIGIFLLLNKKYKKRLILCPFGTGPLNPLLKGKSVVFVNDFINHLKFGELKDESIKRKLKKFDLVVVQNDVLKKCFEQFYDLNNVFVLRNFRINHIEETNDNYIKNSIVFVSRLVEEKGILDLVKVVTLLNSNNNRKITLDIYGEMHLKDDNLVYFNNNLNPYIRYYGPIPNEKVQSIISSHSISCLPTKYIGEGTPGFLIESLISGVPPIVSSFSQVGSIVIDNYNGVIFDINNVNDLKEKIEKTIYDDEKILLLRKNAFESGKQYALTSNIEPIKKMIEG